MTKADNFNSDIHSSDYLSEYERKRITSDTLMDISRREKWSLDGKWNCTPDLYSTALRAHWVAKCGLTTPQDFSEAGLMKLKVPSCWNTVKELKYFEGCMIYTRMLKLDESMKGHKRYFLHFEGSAYRTYVFINGEYLGLHDGASTPFTVEITRQLKEENQLAVIVSAERKREQVPCENTDWFNYAGLFRSVYLTASDEQAYVRSTFIHYEGGVLKVRIDYAGKNTKEAVLRSRGFRAVIPPSGSLDIPFENAHLWSPEDPYLYTFHLDAGKEHLTYRVGLRTIEAKEGEILLNGHSIRLNGICVHEEYPGKGRSASDRDILSVIRDAKELGCNFLRLAHYPHTRRFAELADREGILLWEELPVYWAIQFDSLKTYSDAENQLSELILRDRSRASVIIWSVGNENADTDARLLFMSRLAEHARRMDTSRPVSAACLVNEAKLKIEDRLEKNLDIIGVNEYYGWYDEDYDKVRRLFENSRPEKPVILTEFGAGARAGYKGAPGEIFSEENQADFYSRQLSIIEKIPYIKGTTPWILYDFSSPRRMNIYQDGCNSKGLIDRDHKTHKMAFDILKEYYRRNKG